jgi:hypothetical protein
VPFREEILNQYPRAIQELTRRGVSIAYIATNNTFLLKNKQGEKKVLKESDIEAIENGMKPVGTLKPIELDLSDKLL